VRNGVRVIVNTNLRGRNRFELATVVLLAALLLLLVPPFNPQPYIYEWFARIYFADQLSRRGLASIFHRVPLTEGDGLTVTDGC
ncbi:MAG: hypothetical protein WA962_10500, partial [Ornithinimicrobium sp.]